VGSSPTPATYFGVKMDLNPFSDLCYDCQANWSYFKDFHYRYWEM